MTSPLNGGAGLAGKSSRKTAEACDTNASEMSADTTAHFIFVVRNSFTEVSDIVVQVRNAGNPARNRQNKRVKEFLKEHRTVQQLEADAAQTRKQVEALTASLQKVSAQLELSKPAPQTALNNQIKLIDSYHSLKSPACSCVSITLRASS